MNRKQEVHLSSVPKVKVGRSRFNMDFGNLTSFNTGQLIPLCKPIEVVPGDTFSWSTSSLVRMTTLIAPIMDNLYFDTFMFYVPSRLIWEHFTNFLGENDTTPWVNESTYSVPQVTSPDGGWSVGTLADYFGLPVNVSNLSVSALPFRAYAKIVKDWFYNENVQTPPNVPLNDATIAGSNGDDYVIDLCKGGVPFNACKLSDMFSQALPAPQKGSSVVLPLGDNAPVNFGSVDGSDIYNANVNQPVLAQGFTSSSPYQVGLYGAKSDGASPSWLSTGEQVGLYTDMAKATATTINDLRIAFQTQRLLERMARGGTRYFEILASQWGITAPQGLLQRSEYLGGHRSRVQINSVVQTSATDSTSPQGNLAAYSVSTNYHHDFTKSFFEPGYIIVLGCVRYYHSYSQGIPKTFKRKDLFDFYNHAFACIGEQPVYNYEIFAQGTSVDDEVFGYNEAWIDYRVNPNMITGEMRPSVSGSIDFWHLGDNYDSLPMLSNTWMQEDKSNVDRVLSVSSDLSNQFQASFYFKVDAVRPMPLFSVPGLIDHL